MLPIIHALGQVIFRLSDISRLQYVNEQVKMLKWSHISSLKQAQSTHTLLPNHPIPVESESPNIMRKKC